MSKHWPPQIAGTPGLHGLSEHSAIINRHAKFTRIECVHVSGASSLLMIRININILKENY